MYQSFITAALQKPKIRKSLNFVTCVFSIISNSCVLRGTRTLDPLIKRKICRLIFSLL